MWVVGAGRERSGAGRAFQWGWLGVEWAVGLRSGVRSRAGSPDLAIREVF